MTFATVSLAGGTAHAAAPAATTLRLSQPSPITYTNRQVTISGTLQTPAGAGSMRGVGGEPVSLTESSKSGRISLGTVTTGSDGSFSLTTTVPGSVWFEADFAGDASHGSSTGYASVGVAPDGHLPTRITLDPIAPVTTGSTMRLTGLVEIQTPDQGWIPSAYTQVWATTGTWQGDAGFADANGRFSLGVPAYGVRNIGAEWGAATRAGESRTFASAAQSQTYPVVLNPAQTRITAFSAGPRPATAQNGLFLTGHVDMMIDGQWQASIPAAPGVMPFLDLYFQPKGSSTWINMPNPSFASGPNAGDFHIDALRPYQWNGTGYDLTEGLWQVRVDGAGNRWLPTSTDSQDLQVNVKTAIDGLRIRHWGPHARWRTLLGTLDIQPGPALPADLPRVLPGQAVKIYYRAKGSKAWRSIAVVTTDKNGAFSYPLTRRPHGYYRVVFTSNGYYDATTSPSVTFAN